MSHCDCIITEGDKQAIMIEFGFKLIRREKEYIAIKTLC